MTAAAAAGKLQLADECKSWKPWRPLQPGDKDKDRNVVGYKLNMTETTRKPLLVKFEIKIRLQF